MRESYRKPPQLNTSPCRDYLVHSHDVQKIMFEEMADVGITPEKYPRAVDFAAGNGGFAAKILLPQGWQAGNITNIDIAVPNPDISPGTRWIHLDLYALGYALFSGDELPKEVSGERERYDFASTYQSGSEVSKYIDYLGDFFLRKGGVFLATGITDKLLQPRIGKWKKVHAHLFEKE